ncbi:hypothetical protein ACUXVT_05985 [Acinetobacter soli]|uniref:hypothetical protein n=1 Tax=Acinetobacter soli TaxID=487316 RepID=UPI0040559D8A
MLIILLLIFCFLLAWVAYSFSRIHKNIIRGNTFSKKYNEACEAIKLSEATGLKIHINTSDFNELEGNLIALFAITSSANVDLVLNGKSTPTLNQVFKKFDV